MYVRLDGVAVYVVNFQEVGFDFAADVLQGLPGVFLLGSAAVASVKLIVRRLGINVIVCAVFCKYCTARVIQFFEVVVFADFYVADFKEQAQGFVQILLGGFF